MKAISDFSFQARRFVRAIAAYGVALLFVLQVMLGLAQFQWNLTEPLLEPNRTTEEKFRSAWGTFFDVVQFVKTQTPPDAVILIDSEYIYHNLMLYFLYPRRLLFGGESVFRANSEIGFILITDGYPDYAVTGETKMLDDSHGLLRVSR